MNPLKTLFSKVFETAPSADSPADASKENSAFEWNPEEETVAPTSAQGVSWKRGGTTDEAPARSTEAAHQQVAASAHSLPTPTFDKNAPAAETTPVIVRPAWTDAALPVTIAIETVSVAATAVAPEPAVVTPPTVTPAQPKVESWVSRPSMMPETQVTSAPAPAAALQPGVAHPVIPVSDFEEVYRKAGIKSPVHGYGVERVYRLLTSRRLAGLDRSVRRSALLTALDAAGVPASDVSQDAVLRRKALAAYEAEKALELQSLRSRNESRAEALQDTVETFTRQKQSQIERLAQGSTAAVRAQSDLEIRKRMEQDRLYRSLAYFVEPMPTIAAYQPPAPPRLERRPEPVPAAIPHVIEVRPETEMALTAETSRPVPPAAPAMATPSEPVNTAVSAPVSETMEAGRTGPAIVTPLPTETDADTRPMAQSGMEMALRAAAEEAKNAGWGKAAIVEDTAVDAVEALRKLREAQKPDSES